MYLKTSTPIPFPRSYGRDPIPFAKPKPKTRPYVPANIPVTEVPVRRNDTGEVAFVLSFYGLSYSDLMEVPNRYLAEACARKGITKDRYSISIFEVREVGLLPPPP